MTCFRFGRCCWALLLALLPTPVAAQIVVSFYAHELGSSFPHAFVIVKGVRETGGAPIDTNFGFTAKSLSPALLFGSVVGVVETVTPRYVASSHLQFTLTVTDAQYAALNAVVTKWRSLPGKSYNLNHHNCVHFVGEAAQAVGLRVNYDQALIKKPRSFLQAVLKLNPSLLTPAAGSK
jgi:hypothetical protein